MKESPKFIVYLVAFIAVGSVAKAVEVRDQPTFDTLLKDLTKNDPARVSPNQAARPTTRSGPQLTVSELDRVGRQIYSCWYVPAGADAQNNVTPEFRVYMNPDGTVNSVVLLNNEHIADPYFRATSESARRALLNPRCSPLELPTEKYAAWKTFTIAFDPKDIAEHVRSDGVAPVGTEQSSDGTYPVKADLTATATEELTANELALVQKQIYSCWNIPIGLEIQNPTPEFYVSVNREGAVDAVSLLNPENYSDPVFRVAADSARLALLNLRCSPLKLPSGKFDFWKKLTITFDPGELYGLGPIIVATESDKSAEQFDEIRGQEEQVETERRQLKTTTISQVEAPPAKQISEQSDSQAPIGKEPMTQAFTILTQAVLFAAALLQLWLIARLILWPWGQIAAKNSHQETLMRGIAGVVGLMLYIGSRAIGVSVPELAFRAMSNSFPLTVALGGIVLPSAVGLLVSWFVVRHISGRDAQKDAVAMRVLTMAMALVFFVYCDSWFYTFAQGGRTLQFLPNLTFVLAALLYAIFRYHPYDHESKA